MMGLIDDDRVKIVGRKLMEAPIARQCLHATDDNAQPRPDAGLFRLFDGTF